MLLDKGTTKVYLTGRYSDLSASVTASHIHIGRVGVNGGVIVNLQNSGSTSGTLHGAGFLTSAQVDSLQNARTYINVHTLAFPGGELRGQINTFVQQNFFGGRLSGANEVPANGSAATGTVIVRYNGLTNEIELFGDYQGLTGTITGSHIHNGASGANGPIVVHLTNTDGPFGGLYYLGQLTDDQEALLMSGNLYVNIHSTAFSGGEIRSQLIPQTAGETQFVQAQLSGLQEVPANNSTASGAVVAIVDKVTGQAYVTGTFLGLSGPITGSHVHRSPAGLNGPVIIPLTNAGTTAGTFSGAQVISPALVDSFIYGLTYVNIHSQTFPGGELRAQLGNLVLPVKLGAINGELRKNLAIITWEALSEENLKHYEVQQQNTHNGTWLLKAIIKPKELTPTLYTAEDLPNDYGVSFVHYRLRIVDKDGRVDYSKVIKLNRLVEKGNLSILSNPVRNQLVYNLAGFNSNQKAEVEIIDNQGRMVNRQIKIGLNNNILNTSSLAGGIYILKIQVDGQIISQRFLKY